MTEILNVVGYALQETIKLSFRILDGLDGTELIFGAFCVVTVYRLLLQPILGGRLSIGGRSESVKVQKNDKGDVEE